MMSPLKMTPRFNFEPLTFDGIAAISLRRGSSVFIFNSQLSTLNPAPQ
jgi:hypothetical protein